MRGIVKAVALGCAAMSMVLGWSAPPAQAAGSLVMPALDTATAGRVAGSVQTDAPYVRLRLLDPTKRVVKASVSSVDESHQVQFAFETWGLTTGSIEASVCTGPEDSTCGDPVVDRPFDASDVPVTVSWSEDTTVGTASPFEVTVTDPGGAALWALWKNGYEPVAHNGTTTLSLPGGDGSDTVELVRCSTTSPTECRSLAVSPPIEVLRTVKTKYIYSRPGYVKTTDDSMTGFVYLATGSDVTVTWQVLTEQGVPIDGWSGTATGLTPDAVGYVSFQVPTRGRPEGTYQLSGSVSYDADGFGPISATWTSIGVFGLTSALVIDDHWAGDASWSMPTVYPVKDGYRDQATVTWHGGGTLSVTYSRAQIVSSQGVVVRSYVNEGVTWDGRDEAGAIVPDGDYRAHLFLYAQGGNTGEVWSTPISVSHQQLRTHRVTRKVSARASLESKDVGRCSTTRPRVRGWHGSLGLYSNTRCHRALKQSLVTTYHAMRLPAAARSGSFTLQAYGTAAKSVPRSRLYLALLWNDRKWSEAVPLSSKKRWHPTGHHDASSYMFGDNYIVWAAFTGQGARYDLKGFRVTMTYRVLE